MFPVLLTINRNISWNVIAYKNVCVSYYMKYNMNKPYCGFLSPFHVTHGKKQHCVLAHPFLRHHHNGLLSRLCGCTVT